MPDRGVRDAVIAPERGHVEQLPRSLRAQSQEGFEGSQVADLKQLAEVAFDVRGKVETVHLARRHRDCAPASGVEKSHCAGGWDAVKCWPSFRASLAQW